MTLTMKESMNFSRKWVQEIEFAPNDVIARVRGIDFAFSAPSEQSPNPDWTASVRVSKTVGGYYVVEQCERYRGLLDNVLSHIVATDKLDREQGLLSVLHIPTDPGRAGKIANEYILKDLVEKGVVAISGPVVSQGKYRRMQPFLALAEAGLVKIVKGQWNDDWYDELENFSCENLSQKDDMWDATANAVAALARNQTTS